MYMYIEEMAAWQLLFLRQTSVYAYDRHRQRQTETDICSSARPPCTHMAETDTETDTDTNTDTDTDTHIIYTYSVSAL